MGPLSYTFLRNVHIARSVGWLLFAVLLTALLFRSEMHPGWWISSFVFAIFYPHFACWCTIKSQRPIQTIFGFQLLETGIALTYCALLDMDPWLVTTVVVIHFLNSVLASGIGAGALLLSFVIPVAAGLKYLSPLPSTDIVPGGTLFIGALLVLYLGLIGYRTQKLSVDYSRDRKQLKEEKQTVERLHQHFIDTVVQPYMSADEFVTLIRPQISEEQALAFKERIQKRQQLESLGRRAGGIAHDAKNLLQPILIISEMLKTDLGEDPETAELLEDIIAASLRANELLTQLQVARQPSLVNTEFCNIRTTIGEAVRLLEQTASQFVHVAFHHDTLPPEHSHVAMQATTLHQVVMNLGLNGIQAMDGTGSLEVVLSDFDPNEEEIILPDHLIERGCIALTVGDTGCGISKSHIDKIFEPYFTTKGNSGGTGLGLATTQAVVHDAGGMIRVLSKAHVGTKFRILLPRYTTPNKTE